MLFKSWGIVIAIPGLLVNAHTVISYPGWRGNNLITNDEFPYSMQWSYPCGGLPLSTNRTKWPVTGGAIAVEPGWFTGHSKALIYINLGLGSDGPDGGPRNMSFPMVPAFQISAGTNDPYPGTFCLPQVPLPADVTVKVGDHATIQVIETTIHGGALYNCVDITFALPDDVEEVTASNCFNSTDIAITDPFASATIIVSSRNSTETATSCPACSTSPTSAACPTQTACPQTNGNGGTNEGLGVGIPLGVLALGILGL